MASKIPNKAIPELYRLSRKVYEGEMDRKNALALITQKFEIKKSSASDFLRFFVCLREGREYHRTINKEATRFFMKRIASEGNDVLALAIQAVKKHVIYYKTIRGTYQRGAWRIAQEFEQQLSLTDDNLEQEFAADLINTEKLSREDLIQILEGRTPRGNESSVVKLKRLRRDNLAIAIIKQLRGYQCQICSASITRKDGTSYIEAAHITPKHQHGDESSSNILVLCPNHHKEFDLGNCEIKDRNANRVEFELNGKKYKIDLNVDQVDGVKKGNR